MSAEKIVITTSVYDQADILSDYLEWHLELGVDQILVQDCGSTDGGQDVLRRFTSRRRVCWFVLPERNMLKYDSAQVLSERARREYGAEWIIQCDADEFLCPDEGDLRMILRHARADGFTVVTVPCFNMIGRPMKSGQAATQALTLRIDQPVVDTTQLASGHLSVPLIFIKPQPKTIVWASALTGYGPGTHEATCAWGRNGEVAGLRFLHYPIRGFDKLQQKVHNTAAWLEDNPHLPAVWGWHWRHWIHLEREGRLREDYDNQFVSPTRVQELLREGACTLDDTVARWRTRKLPAGVRLTEQDEAIAAQREALTALQHRLAATSGTLAETQARMQEAQTRLTAAEIRLDQTLETMRVSVQGLIEHSARLEVAERERAAALAQVEAAERERAAALAQADTAERERAAALAQADTAERERAAALAQADAAKREHDTAERERVTALARAETARAEATAGSQLLSARDADISALRTSLDHAIEKGTRLSAKLVTLATENEAFHERRAIRWADRLRRGEDLSDSLDPAFQRLRDDSLLFAPDLRGFALRPSENLQTVAFVAYPLGPLRQRLSSLLLAPILTVPFSAGVLGIELVVTERIVARSHVAFDQIDERRPTRFVIPPLAPSSDQPLWLRVYARDAAHPVRIFEWQRPEWPSVGAVQRRAFAGLIFET